MNLITTERRLLWLAFTIFKLFGFIPFPFDRYNIKLKPSSSCTTLLKFYVLQLLFYIAVFWMAILYRSDMFHNGLQVLSMNEILKYFSNIWITFVILIITVLQRKIHRSVWVKLDQVRNLVSKVFLRRFIRFYLCKFYGYLAYSGFIEAQMMYIVLDSPMDFAYRVALLVLHTFVRLQHLFHMFFIDVLKTHLQQLHYDLKELSEYMRKLDAHPYESPIHRNTYERSVKRLLELKEIYGKLWEISDCINRTFGWSQICNFTGNFVQLSCDLYWCYLSVQGVFDNYFYVFGMLLPTSLLLWLLLSSAESCLRVASSLPEALLEVPIENDSTFRKIIYRFGLQMAQQRIRLTAHGLFEINYSLLKMFGTGMTTYMIIFITFSKKLRLEELQTGL
uniref:Gustatory receptor n=1 Tax=Anopheles dirus TaxID=7168 RepID=A0A182NZ58_9DIPT